MTMKAACVSMVVGVILVGATAASAQTSRAGVAFKVSTLGIGFDLAVPAGERVNVRGGFSFFDFNHEFDTDGITLDAQLKMRSVSASMDWFPFAGSFHVSPGLMLYNGNQLNANARVPAGTRFSLGDADLISNPSNPVSGGLGVAFKRVAPSILVGWGNIVPRGERRWSIPVELGVVYTRAPSAAINLVGSACAFNGTNCRSIASEPLLQAELAKEQAQLNDDIGILKMIPVVSVGFSYKF